MKKLPGFIFLFVLFAACPAFSENQLVDRVVAVVNDDPITQSELDGYMRTVYEQLRREYEGQELAQRLDSAQQKILSQMIEDRIVYLKAKENKIEATEQEIEKEMDLFRKRFGHDGNLEDDLRREGLTLSKIRERIEQQIMIRKLQDMEVRAKVMVSPAEIDAYYEGHSQDFVTPTRIRLRSITIKKNEQARDKGIADEAAKQRIQELQQRILAGESFTELATENSEDYQAGTGGLSDWITPGSMIPTIEDVVFKLKKGETSQIIETPLGYHLFRVDEREDGAQKDREEIRDEIYDRLFREKAGKRFEEWMEELKRQSYISIR